MEDLGIGPFQSPDTIPPTDFSNRLEAEIKRKYVSALRTAILNEGGFYASGKYPGMIQAVLSREASTASGSGDRAVEGGSVGGAGGAE
ncbi:MAG TPA: hypothetical protein VLL97_11790 [Acidobacteriota bacterium]|nr:hypothetical protein [Acidobacteriota bacterium]